MQYLGGKSRLARKIVDVLREKAPETIGVIEPFCGGCAVTEHLCAWRPTLAADAFPGLVGMLCAVRQGLRLPVEGVTDEQYAAFKAAAESGDRSPSTVAVGFGLSFGGKWFGGNARCVQGDPKREYARYWNSWADRFSRLQNLTLIEADYRNWTDLARPGVVFYCDPPYWQTEGYETGIFDHFKFDQICWLWRSRGARVFVSEYDTQWTEVWSHRRNRSISNQPGVPSVYVTDRLFEVLP
jgi:DNA adenine methylase